jgi:hypothetical protein
MVDGTSEGRTYDGRWSVGNRVQGIEPGDRAYLLRQGTHGRGLVAIGDITSEPFTDDSWRNDGGTAQYVYVTWLEAVPLEQRVEIHDLMAAIPAFRWDNIYSSGRDITEHGAALEGLWFGQVTEAAPLPAVVQGAGFGTAERIGRSRRPLSSTSRTPTRRRATKLRASRPRIAVGTSRPLEATRRSTWR